MPEVAYSPVMLNSTGAICKYFGVGAQRVREWSQAGAPIAVEYDAKGVPVRYRCEAMRLYLWLEGKAGSKMKGVNYGGAL